MVKSWITRWLKKKPRPSPRPGRNSFSRSRLGLNLEGLGERICPAVTASFIPSTGVLTVFGDAGNNTININRDAAGNVLVNGGAIQIVGGKPTVANTSSISVFGQGGDDQLTLNEANGALPKTTMFGGAGNDTITGGSGDDLLFGQAGNDTLLGKGGNDLLFGGADNDTLTGGVGDDQVFGEAGNDRMIWNPGEGSDLNEGGDGIDTVEVNGGNGAEVFTATANGTRVRFDRVTPAPFFVDIGTSENLVLNANGGNDSFSATGNLATLISITVDGGTGNDTLLGGNGVDHLFGGDGDDFIDGNQGNDIVMMGAGNDTFQWDPGDGSDTVEGQAGADTMVFNGSAIGENIEVSPNGDRTILTRNVGAIVMDFNDIETLNINALGGADSITIDDLSASSAIIPGSRNIAAKKLATAPDVTQVNISLASQLGGTAGDTAADLITVFGTQQADNISVVGAGTSASVLGLPAQVNITGTEVANDSLSIIAQAGNDGISAATLPADVIRLTLDGGAGDDSILGSQGVDMLLGGDGNDFIDGNQGNDTALMGTGNDVFQWDPGDGSDIVEGQGGTDEMLFFGSNIAENFDISANGSRVRFTRDVGTITMDLNGVESIELRTLGGADSVTVNDLTGTDLTSIELGLRGPNGGGDGSADSITVNATQGADNFGVAGDSGGVRVFGLQAEVKIFDTEAALDSLTVNGQGGADIIDAKSLQAGAVQLTINSGDGDDTITGSEGSDLINGGRGNDVAFMGAGDDTFVWNPGDGSDLVEGQDGVDTMLFNGANIAEHIEMSANGSRLRFTRDIAAITMDAGGLEHVVFNALGGADSILVGDLSGTDVTQVDINLAATGGVGDGAADVVTVNGTAGDDVIVVSGDAAGAVVMGLPAQVNITGAEPANDQLKVFALAGNDVVQGSSLSANAIQFFADGGVGDDILIGGDGNDTLMGGDGDDILIGLLGQDVLDGGTGDNVLIQ